MRPGLKSTEYLDIIACGGFPCPEFSHIRISNRRNGCSFHLQSIYVVCGSKTIVSMPTKRIRGPDGWDGVLTKDQGNKVRELSLGTHQMKPSIKTSPIEWSCSSNEAAPTLSGAIRHIKTTALDMIDERYET